MKQQFFLIVLLSFIISVAQTQNPLAEFDLSTYKLPDIKRHKLDLSTYFGSSFLNYDFSDSDQKTKNVSGSGYLNLNYNFYRNSAKYQGETRVGLNGQFGSSRYDFTNQFTNIDGSTYDITDNYKSGSMSGSLDILSNNRFYFNGLTFFEAGLDAYFGKGQEKRDQTEHNYNLNTDQITKSTDLSSTYQFEMPIYIGYGRIERVEDARQAIFILKDLQRFGRLKRVPDNDEIIALSEKFSAVKNKRFFDSRLQKMDELDTADTYLHKMDLISETDIAYFASLNDMWNYGDLQTRQAGYRIFGGVIPALGIYNDHNTEDISLESKSPAQEMTSDYKNDNQTQRILLNVGFEYQKPIKQKWQYFLVSFARVGPSKTTNKNTNLIGSGDESETSLKLTEIIGNVETGFGFYPNTRTYIDLSFNAYINYDKGTYTSNYTNIEYDEDAKNTFYSLSMRLGAYYYISPRLRLSGDYAFNYTNLDGVNSLTDKYQTWNYFNYTNFNMNIDQGENKYKKSIHDFRVTLTYSIF